MLPGVELARRRRIHHHGGIHDVVGTAAARPLPHPSNFLLPRYWSDMDESALLARKRLEKKLHGSSSLSPPPPPVSPTTNASSSTPTTRWMMFPGEARSHIDNGIARNVEARTPRANTKPAAIRRPPSVLERRDSEDVCAVCLDEFQTDQYVTNLPCSHKYHSDCVLPWLVSHSQCPCCRKLVFS